MTLQTRWSHGAANWHAKSPADVQRDFTLTPGSSVPILVEYRSIPNVQPRDGLIPWRP